MPARYWIRVTDHAEQSMHEIVNYITWELFAPCAAQRILRILTGAIRDLDEMPARFPLTPDEPWRSKGIHRMVVERYYIYFLIDELRHIVHVTDVVSIRVNQIERLEMMPTE